MQSAVERQCWNPTCILHFCNTSRCCFTQIEDCQKVMLREGIDKNEKMSLIGSNTGKFWLLKVTEFGCKAF